MISTPGKTPSRGIDASPMAASPLCLHAAGEPLFRAIAGSTSVAPSGTSSLIAPPPLWSNGQVVPFEVHQQLAGHVQSNSYTPPTVQQSEMQARDQEDKKSFCPAVASSSVPQRSWIAAPVRNAGNCGAPPPMPARILPSQPGLAHPQAQSSSVRTPTLASATAVASGDIPATHTTCYQMPVNMGQAAYPQASAVPVDVEVIPHMLQSDGFSMPSGESLAYPEAAAPRLRQQCAVPVRPVASYVAGPMTQTQLPPQQPIPQQPLQPRLLVPTVVPTISGVDHFEPERVLELLRSDERCVLIDLRGDDRAAGLIEGSVNIPAVGSASFLTKVPDLVRAYCDQDVVIFTCQYSVHRAPQCANWYREQANPQQRVGILEGGFRGWEARGLPVASAADGQLRGSTADHYAMQQGLRFVQQYAPQVYEHAERVNKTQLDELLQPLRQATSTTAQAPAQAVQAQPQAQPHAHPQRQTPSQRQRKYQPPNLPNTVPTKAGVEHLDPWTVHELLQDRRCVLIDLRGEDRAAGLIEGAVPVPAIGHVPFITKVPALVKKFCKDDLVVFTCQYSAHRAPQCANWYRDKASPQQRVAILAGGFRGWEAECLPVVPCTTSAIDSGNADDFAMNQGVNFVKQYAPKIYQQAQQKQRQQREEQSRPQQGSLQVDQPSTKEEPTPHSPHQSPLATEKVPPRGHGRSHSRSPVAQHLPHTLNSDHIDERSEYGSECSVRGVRRRSPPPPSRSARSGGHTGRAASQDFNNMGRSVRQHNSNQAHLRLHPSQPRPQAHRVERSQTPTVAVKKQGQAQVHSRARTPTKQPVKAVQSPHERPHLPNTVPTIAGVEHLEPEEVFELMWSKECTLVDVRGEDRSAGLIEGALHVPAIDKVMFPAKVPELVQRFKSEPLVVFTCQYSAHRAPQCANWYREQADPAQRVAILAGGFRGWEAQGFPVHQGATSSEQAASADKFAMRQGVGFVKRYVPEVYQQARKQKDAQQLQLQKACAQQHQVQKQQHQQQKQQHLQQRQQQQVLQEKQQQQSDQLPPPTQQPLHELQPQQIPEAQVGMTDKRNSKLREASSKRKRQPLPNTVPTQRDVEHLEPEEVHELLQAQACILVDVRGDDRAAGLIEGAIHVPAIGEPMFHMRVPELVKSFASQPLVIFTCQYSAHRAPQCANWYRDQASHEQRVAVLAGGFRGWEAQGLPVLSAANPNEATATDEFAMEQGLNFVREYASQSYDKVR